MGTHLQEGQMAPDFELPHRGGTLRLSNLRGERVALYFFPESFSKDCTAEACNLRDSHPSLEGLNLRVIGISADDQETQERFEKEYDLPFPVLSDEGGRVAADYGVFGIKRADGSILDQARRVTFILGEDGRILKIIDPVTAATHSDQIAAALEQTAS